MLYFIVGAASFVIAFAVAAFIFWNAGIADHKKKYESKVCSAEERSKQIIEEALKEAEQKKREAIIEAKDEISKARDDLEKERKDRMRECANAERRVISKEDAVDKKAEALEKRDQRMAQKEAELDRMRAEVAASHQKQLEELERISGLTSEQAKEYLLKSVEEDVKHETAVMIKDLETQAKDEADKKAKDIIVTAIQRCAADHVAESTISVVQLPNDEMKGRIIGREGRNIRTFETMTGIELIIDDTPEAIVLSGFDPIRREVARITLERLIADGRIHPARIEEMVEKAQKEVETMIREEGENAALECGVHGLHPELIKLLGRMNSVQVTDRML